MIRKWLRRIALVAALVVVVVPLAAVWLLRASLPRLEGNLRVDGLSAPVEIERDGLGVPTIRGNRNPDEGERVQSRTFNIGSRAQDLQVRIANSTSKVRISLGRHAPAHFLFPGRFAGRKRQAQSS